MRRISGNFHILLVFLCLFVVVLPFLHADTLSIRPPGGDTAALQESLISGDPVTSMTYLSFVTLTTLGYGDMLPATRATRMLAWVEAVSGQLYLAILVAWLVGMYLSHSQQPRDG